VEKDILFQFKDFPNYAEDEYMFVSDTPNYTLHPHENDKVFGPVGMYMTQGWYEFQRGNNLGVGDKLQFQLSDPPYVVVIDIVRKRGND
jgi:hypothetical protein